MSTLATQTFDSRLFVRITMRHNEKIQMVIQMRIYVGIQLRTGFLLVVFFVSVLNQKMKYVKFAAYEKYLKFINHFINDLMNLSEYKNIIKEMHNG